MRASEDGTYTYVFLMDPLVDAFDYGIAQLLRRAYGDAQAAEYDKLWDEAMASTGEPVTALTAAHSAPWGHCERV